MFRLINNEKDYLLNCNIQFWLLRHRETVHAGRENKCPTPVPEGVTGVSFFFLKKKEDGWGRWVLRCEVTHSHVHGIVVAPAVAVGAVCVGCTEQRLASPKTPAAQRQLHSPRPAPPLSNQAEIDFDMNRL